MNIWIDICNAPHVIFFKEIIKDWETKGYEVVVTARELSGSLELLDLNNITYTEIGGHYGKNYFAKIWGLISRCLKLLIFLKDKKLDVSVSQSSFYSPLVSFFLGIPSVYTNDNEYARGNILAHIFAKKILYPEALKYKFQNSIFKNKLAYYPGVKEGIYLHKFTESSNSSRSDKGSEKICIRPEPWTAQYHKKNDAKFEDFLCDLAKKYNITILPRGEIQKKYYKSRRIDNFMVAKKPMTLEQIIKNFDFFIGGGGSMSRETAFLGMPTLSIYQGELLAVDLELINRGYLMHTYSPNPELVERLLEKKHNPANTLALKLEGEKAKNMLVNEVITICNSK